MLRSTITQNTLKPRYSSSGGSYEAKTNDIDKTADDFIARKIKNTSRLYPSIRYDLFVLIEGNNAI